MFSVSFASGMECLLTPLRDYPAQIYALQFLLLEYESIVDPARCLNACDDALVSQPHTARSDVNRLLPGEPAIDRWSKRC